MREIKFRGKRVDNGKWVYGGIANYGEHFFVVESQLQVSESDNIYFSTTGAEVTPETVGQFTGLHDKNGKEIYEGDILRFDDTGEEGYEYKEWFDFINMAVVIWHAGRFELDNFASTNSGVLDEMNHCQEDFIFVFSGAEVIGNIYENPDLIEGGAD